MKSKESKKKEHEANQVGSTTRLFIPQLSPFFFNHVQIYLGTLLQLALHLKKKGHKLNLQYQGNICFETLLFFSLHGSDQKSRKLAHNIQ